MFGSLLALVLLSSMATAAPLEGALEIEVHLSPWRDPNTGRDHDQYLELPSYASFITRSQRDRAPAYRTDLRLWIQLPGYSDVQLRTDLPVEQDPHDSPYRLKGTNHVLALPLETRNVSFAVKMRSAPDQVIERWIHVSVKNSKPIFFTDPVCESIGLYLDPITPPGNEGQFSWVSLACVMVEESKTKKRFYALIRHSADGEFSSRRVSAFAEAGQNYLLADLTKLSPERPVEFELRKPGTAAVSRFRLAHRQPKKDREGMLSLGFGTQFNSLGDVQGRTQDQITLAFRLKWRTIGDDGLDIDEAKRAMSISFEAGAAAVSLYKKEEDPNPTYLDFHLGADFALPWCPFDLIDSPCRIGVGGFSWIPAGTNQQLFPPGATFGPEISLRLFDGAMNPKRHQAYFRFGMIVGDGYTFALSNRELTMGALFLVNNPDAEKHTWLALELSQRAATGTQGFDYYSGLVQLVFDLSH